MSQDACRIKFDKRWSCVSNHPCRPTALLLTPCLRLPDHMRFPLPLGRGHLCKRGNQGSSQTSALSLAGGCVRRRPRIGPLGSALCIFAQDSSKYSSGQLVWSYDRRGTGSCAYAFIFFRAACYGIPLCHHKRPLRTFPPTFRLSHVMAPPRRRR